MADPAFAVSGNPNGTIDVRLSYRIVELFSEGLYSSPNKALEELVANSFDAGAQRVHVHLSASLHDQDATIVVVDDGQGMDADGLRQHWLVGMSNKRTIPTLPKGRQQIGRFGIGKLATYVLADRLTHITKVGGKFFSASMDYSAIDQRVEKALEPKAPIKIPLRELTAKDAEAALKQWLDLQQFVDCPLKLFGAKAPASWTVAVMSGLKPKVHEIKPGHLEWVLRTALPLRPDFGIWLNGAELTSSKASKGKLRKWILGNDLKTLPKPCPKGHTAFHDENAKSEELQFGLEVPGLGRVTGFAEGYKDMLTGKSDAIGRSHGFFVYVRERLVNVLDGHFGISPDELRHGTFGRFRTVVHMDGLDAGLRSNREAISEGPLLATAQDVLRGIFNSVRHSIEKQEEDEEPGNRLRRKFAASPASVSSTPIVDLARAVSEGKAKSRYVRIPKLKGDAERTDFVKELEKRASGDEFVSNLVLDWDTQEPSDGIAQFDAASGTLRINAWHPFVAAFYDEYISMRTGQPLHILAMAEVLAEAQLHVQGVKRDEIETFLASRDQLLRSMASEWGRQSAHGVALALLEARNNPTELERTVCLAFSSLGFDVTPIGGPGKPDGVATALLSADQNGRPRQYKVSLEAKSKEEDEGKVAAGTVKLATVTGHRDSHGCQHAIVVGRDFPTTKGEKSSLAQQIDKDRESTEALVKTNKRAERGTVTLITIDDLAQLVRLRPIKQLGLAKLRELFECRLPEETREWIAAVAKTTPKKPPYRQVVEAIEGFHKKYQKLTVKYDSLLVTLDNQSPPVSFASANDLAELCKAMAQMAPGAIFATNDSVELDTSAANALAAIESATKELTVELK